MSGFSSESLLQRWEIPEVQDLIRRHTIQQIDSGIYESFSRSAQTCSDADSPLYQIRQLISNAELPLIAKVDTGPHHMRSITEYYLERIDPKTGETYPAENDWHELADSRTYVIFTRPDGTIDTLNPNFSLEQASIVIQQAEELSALGID